MGLALEEGFSNGRQPRRCSQVSTLRYPDKASEVVKEAPFEVVASICSVLVVGLFILTFLGQNFVIPSGSMENTLLVGDHLLVDRSTLASPANWMPLVHYREPQRGDVVVFIKPVPDPDAEGNPQYFIWSSALSASPATIFTCAMASFTSTASRSLLSKTAMERPAMSPSEQIFLDEFPSVSPADNPSATTEWAVESSKVIENGDLIVPPASSS